MTSTRDRGIAVVLMSVVLLSAGSTIAKSADAAGSVVAAWRLVLAAGAWWVMLALRHRRRGTPFPSMPTWRAAAPAGIFFGLDLALFFTGINSTSVAHAEFIGSLTPLLLVPIAMIIFGERLNAIAVPFGLVTLAGLAVFMFNGPDGGVATLRGDLLVVGALGAWVCYMIVGRRARATVGVSEFMAVVMTVASAVAVPIALLVAADEIWPLSARTWVAVVLLAVITGMLGHALIAVAQRLLDVGTISVLQVLQPVAAVTWAWVVLGEEIAVAQFPGVVMIVGGLVGFVVANRPRRTVVEAAPAVDLDPAPVTPD